MILDKYSDDITTHYSKNNIEFIKFKALEKYNSNLEHLITLRHGGVSKFPVETLNFRTVGKDPKENILENLSRTCNSVNISPDLIYKAKQEHTDNILIIDNDNKENFKFTCYSNENYDGYVVCKPDIATLITTADCNPILIYDPENNVYANVHSGWKGTLKRIYIKAIKIMQEKYNSNLNNLIVCIGPSIRKCCFSTQDINFVKKFTQIFQNEENWLEYKESSNTYHIDMIKIITDDLISSGIQYNNINVSNICTHCNSDDFYSYRTVSKNKYEDYGVMATIMMLRDKSDY